MRLWLVVISISFISLSGQAYLAPRMYSIIAQGALDPVAHGDASQNSIYSNKVDLNLLYFVRGGPTFGFRYLIESRNESGASESGQSYGPTAGYYWERRFFVLGHYDIFAKLGNWTNGEGPQLDFGYLEHVVDRLHVGFQISNKVLTYKTDITNSLAEHRTVRDTWPSVTLMYLF